MLKNSVLSKNTEKFFMFPLAILAISGLIFGIGSFFSDTHLISLYSLNSLLKSGTVLNFIFNFLKSLGEIIFLNMPLIFAITLAFVLAKKEKEIAGFSSLIAFLTMHQTISVLLNLTGKLKAGAMHEGAIASILGIKSLEMGIFGGILVGLGVGYLHNIFYLKKMPDFTICFGEKSFIPIISFVAYSIIGILMFLIWPWIQEFVFSLGKLVNASKYGGTLFYGIVETAVMPFGLNKLFNLPFLQTSLGGSSIINGYYVTGAQNIFFSEFSSKNINKFNLVIAKFISGKYPFMIFGLPAASLAIYHTAKDDKKKFISGILISLAFICVLAGVSQPLELLILFFSPVLYLVHCFLAGISYMIVHLLKITIGSVFSGGLLDFFFFGILQGNAKTNWIYMIPLGIAYFLIYYFIFKFIIRKFNLKTLGREKK